MKVYHVVIVFCWLSFFYFMGLANIPHSKALEFYTKKNFNFMMPQGWGFFTKDPHEVMIDVYLINDSTLELLSNLNTSKQNLFGLSKNNRYIGFELSKLLGHIPRNAWKNGIGKLNFNEQSSVFTIKSLTSPLKSFPENKIYLLHQYKPIPHAWANSDQEQFRPYLSAIIKINYE